MQLPVLKSPPRSGEPLGRRTFKVGELAKLAGKTVRALHLYEERGLLSPQERSPGGYRLYGEHALRRVRWIAKMQEMGYSLPDLQVIAAQWDRETSAPSAMARVEVTLRDKLDETRAQIARLRTLEAELENSLEYLQTCPSCHPEREIQECHSCDKHANDEQAPDLVAGFRPLAGLSPRS